MAAVWYFSRNNQPKTRGCNGQGMGLDAQPGSDVRGAWFHCFGGDWVGRESKTKIINTLALGGRHFIGGTNGRDDGEEARLGWSVWGWCYFFVWGRKLNNKKITKTKYNVALDGHCLIFYMQQPTKNTQAQWRRDGIECATGQWC
jgi:hypothetical protein